MKTKLTRMISLALALVMCFSMLNVTAFAEELTGEQTKHEIDLSYAGESNLDTPVPGQMDAVKYAELVDPEKGIVKITMDIAGAPVTMTQGVDVVVVSDESASMNMFADDKGDGTVSSGNVGIISLCLNEEHWYGLDKDFVAKLYPNINIPEDASEEEKSSLQAQKDEIDTVLSAVAAWETPLYFQPTAAMRFSISGEWGSTYAADTKSVLTAALNALGDDVAYTDYIDWNNLSRIFGKQNSAYWPSGLNHYVYDEETGDYEKVTLEEGAYTLPIEGNEYGCFDRLTVERSAYARFVQNLLENNDAAENVGQKNRVAYVGFSNRKTGTLVSFQDDYTTKDESAISPFNTPLSLKDAIELEDYYGYTNWAYGLSGALTHVRNRAEDGTTNRPVYVVFLSDGAPNQDGGGNKWNAPAQPEVTNTSVSGSLGQLKAALPAALAAETDGFYAIKYNVDGTDANAYYDLLEAKGAEIWECETATAIDGVLAGINEQIGKFYPSGTLTDTIGEDFTLIEGNSEYPITSGYAKTEENGRVSLTWNFENVTKESVSFYVQLKETQRTTPGTYLTNADTVEEGETVTGANLTYKALSINSDNKLVESPTSVAMRSPEVTVIEFVPMSVTVNKIWDSSASNYMQDVTIRLWADGQEVDNQTLNAENRWTYTWEDLSKYDENENEIEYKITEDDLGRYFYQDIKNEGNVWTITNSYVPVYTSVSVNKVWDDDDNAAGARPTSINVEILKGNSVYATVTLNDANSWSYSSDRILDDGSKWSVSEVEVPENYVSSVNGADGVFTIINTYTVHTLGSIVVNKTTTGAATPAGATFQLQKQEGNEWTNVGEPVAYSAFVENAYTFTELEEGTYRVIESGAEIEEFHLETTYGENVVLTKTTANNGDTSVSSGSALVTNIYTPYIHTPGSIVVNKTTTGAATPAGATFQLQKLNGELWNNVGAAVPFSAFVNNAYTFNGLGEGTYRVVESGAEIEAFRLETTYGENVVLTRTTADNGDSAVNSGSILVTNTYDPFVHTLGSIVVNKTTTGAATPAGATFQLQKLNGETWINVGEAVAFSSFANNAYTFTGLEEGTYRIVESGAEVDGYTLETTYSANAVLTKTTAANGDTSVNSNEISVTNAYVAIEEKPTEPEETEPEETEPEETEPEETEPEETEPEETEPEETVPEETEPEDNIEIPEEDVPLASAPAEEEEEEDIIEIPDEDIPMADVPKTGDLILPFIGMTIASGAATIFVGKTGKKKEDEE